MGCDLSKQTKKEFDLQISELAKSVEIIKKQQFSLENSIENMIIPPEPEETLDSLHQNLLPYLESIERLLLDLKNSNENNEINDIFDKDRNSIDKIQKNKFQVSTKAESCEGAISRGESPNGKNEKEANILEDPMIKALIEKNRQKFAGIKKTV